MVDLAVHVRNTWDGKNIHSKNIYDKNLNKKKKIYKKGVYSFLPKSTLCSWA